jgi:O-antigen/teichoic acid export membrane protein
MVNNVSGQALSLIVFLVTARFVSKEAFGIMAVSLLTVEGFRQIIITSYCVALTAQNNPSDEDYNACFILILLSGIVLAAALFFLAGPIAGFLGHDEVSSTLRYVCLILVTAGLSQTHEVWLSKHLQFRVLALRSILSILIGGGAGAYLAISGYGLDALIAQQIITGVTAVVFLWSTTRWKPKLKTRSGNIRSLLSRSKHLFVGRFTSFAGTQSDIFFASTYLGPTATGTYNAAKRILFALSFTLSNALNAVALPAFAALGHGTDRLGRGFLKMTAFTSLLTAPLYAGLFVLSDDAVRLLLGEKWADAAPVISALIVSAFLTSVGQYNHNVFLVHGKPQWEAMLNVVYTVCNVLLFLWLARYGAVMLAAAYSARSLLLYPLSLVPALHLLKVSFRSYMAAVGTSIVAALAMGLCVWLLKIEILTEVHALARLAILVPTGAAIYAGLIYLLDRKLMSESTQALSLILRRENAPS